MKLGPCVSEVNYPEWRFVEADLYSISDRVKEYDKDCRLGFKESTGDFGLFRHVAYEGIGQAWLLGRRIRATFENGTPDKRVLDEQRESDVQNARDVRSHTAKMMQGLKEARAREARARRDAMGDPAEKFVHAVHRSAGIKNRAYIGKDTPSGSRPAA